MIDARETKAKLKGLGWTNVNGWGPDKLLKTIQGRRHSIEVWPDAVILNAFDYAGRPTAVNVIDPGLVDALIAVLLVAPADGDAFPLVLTSPELYYLWNLIAADVPKPDGVSASIYAKINAVKDAVL